jgi:hypothetical protein
MTELDRGATWDVRFGEAMKAARAALVCAAVEIPKAAETTWDEEHRKLTNAMTHVGILRVTIEAVCSQFKATGPTANPQATEALDVVRECQGRPEFGDAVNAFCAIALDEGWTAAAINAALEPFGMKMEPK